MATIGIVTVLYNSEQVLDGFYESLNSQTYRDFIVYAVENKSPDNSLAKIKELSKKANFETIIIEAGENGGIARGNNIGIDRALNDKCEYILLANNDIEFGPDTLQILFDGLNKYKCNLIVPKIFNYFTGKIWTTTGGYGYKKPTYAVGANRDDAPEYNVAQPTEFAPTCFMLIEKEVFSAVGRMDEKYFVYFDDTDFIWRSVKIHGFTLYYNPEAIVYHKAGTASGSKASPFTFYMNTRNRAYFMNKYFPWYQRLSINIYNFVYYFLYTVKHPDFPSIFKNIGYYREGLKMYHDWKKDNQVKAGSPD